VTSDGQRSEAWRRGSGDLEPARADRQSRGVKDRATPLDIELIKLFAEQAAPAERLPA
jgi:hypothetical protein